MNKQLLNEYLTKYNDLTTQEAELKSQKEILKSKILEEMNSDSLTSFVSDDNIKATIANKVNFKYEDELALINYCKENNLDSYIVTKIDTTRFNTELKNSKSLCEAVSPFIEKSESQTLTVK